MSLERIKVGLLIDSFIVPEWMYEMVKRIAESDYTAIERIIVKQYSTSYGKKEKTLNNLIYRWYRKAENKLVKVRPNAFVKRNIKDLLKHIPVLEVQSSLDNGFVYFEKKNIEEINSYGLDVCIKLGFANLRGEILNCAK